MRFTKITIPFLTLVTAATLGTWPQAAWGQAPPDRPVPRLANGRISFGPPRGEAGLWTPGGIVQVATNPNSVNRPSGDMLPENLPIDEIPFQPWARALYEHRQANFEKDDPHTRCKPSGGPRQFMTPYGNEIVQIPELDLVLIFDSGGPHTWRTVYMDGRPHPEDPTPSAYGHAIGYWEGDTLVVDSVGFNERFWFNREGMPHTDQLHMIERFSRPEFDVLRYEVTIDDPGAYTDTWTGGWFETWSEGTELFEYVCQDNNLSPEGMVGREGIAVGASRIIP
jgi:hypothetical protein